MGGYEDDRRADRRPWVSMPVAMFGFKEGAAWVADDVFVTRDLRGDVLVERWDGRGVRCAVVRRNSEGFMRAMWIKLNEIAVDGIPESAI
ncbi:hypothetical protein C3B78_15260 [Arthrobacter sp. PGP41]|nr:hypothetical protein C3B78_15260 [Arthrobacter sp. PGP41]